MVNDVKDLMGPDIRCRDNVCIVMGHDDSYQYVYPNEKVGLRDAENFYETLEKLRVLPIELKESDDSEKPSKKINFAYERFIGASKLVYNETNDYFEQANKHFDFKILSDPRQMDKKEDEKSKEDSKKEPENINQSSHFNGMFVHNGKLYTVFKKNADYDEKWIYKWRFL